MNQSKSDLISSAEQILGYHFRKPSLLVHALTHDSCSNGTISYERLEFIGDAALSLAMANYLNVTYPKLKLGDISMLRSANVCNEKLARVAVRRNIYPLVQINSPQLDKQVKKFIEAVKQESKDEIYGGSTKKAPKVLADVVEAIAAAIYQDCNFNLDMMWKVVKRLLEPLITADTFKQSVTADTFNKQPVTNLYQLCQKKGKVVEFKPSREGKKTIFEVLIDGEKVGYGSSTKHKYIAKLNAARDALKKLNGEKSNLLIKSHKEVEDEEVKQKPFPEGNKACSVPPKRRKRKKLMTALTQKNGKVVEFKTSPEGKSTTISEVPVDGEKVGYGSSKHKYIPKLNAARDALEKLNGEKSNLSIKVHKEVEDGEKSLLQAPTILHSQHRLVTRCPLSSLSFSTPHEKIETKEKKEYHSVELRPTKDERDKIEEVRKEMAAKQKLNELCMKRHWPPPEYQSETKEMSTEGEKGKGEGHMADPPQHQHPKPTLSPVLTASAQPAPELEESTKYEELEESTESKESQESEESTESEEDTPYMDKVDSYQRKTGYNVTVELEGRERRERRVPCCHIVIGWLLFILGFFLCGIPWCIGAIMLSFSRVDYREKPGYISCTIAVVLATIAGFIINNWSDKRS